MDEALAVYDEDGMELLAEAGELAAGVDAHLTVLAPMTEEEFDEVAETLGAVAAPRTVSFP